MAPGLVTPEKAQRGKLPTDVWWHTIVSPTGREKTGYPTQKPVGLVRRMVAASSARGDWVLDFFAGSGTLGAAAHQLGRRFVCVDRNPEAVEVMRARLVRMASEHDLLVTGSSDYHGSGKPNRLGENLTSVQSLVRIEEQAGSGVPVRYP